MGNTSENKPVKHICLGLLAHVDAGKTTLSEGMLYTAGSIRELGRVDRQDAFLDNYELERARGITIFSKQAVLSWKDLKITLLDTPGHVDFSAEMERTLQVLDYAVLIISAADGVQGHTQTLWRLLKRYQIPVFLFVNKMDQIAKEEQEEQKAALLARLWERLDGSCVDFSSPDSPEFFDALAMCSETAMEQFLEQDMLETGCIADMILKREVFPCFFGSALKLAGVKEFLDGIAGYTKAPQYPQEFAAKAFKITRDDQGNRLTHLKITGGSLKVRTALTGRNFTGQQENVWEEKINQIRIYSGARFEAVNEVQAGTVCAVTGLTQTKPGEGFGTEQDSALPVLEPVLTYRILLPDGCDAAVMLPKLRQLEEEEPQLHIVWDEQLQEIQAQLMGEVQLEILTSVIKERFGITVEFGPGNIVYKETITDRVEGVGHFEPLRHYAEVHLLLEPGEPGSGMQFAADCSEDILDRNWQRLVLTHLEEREHKGVLTGSVLTDMKITLVTGRAHLKHTEGGDFRQATYRAVRQGLMQAQSVLLEPYYDFRLELPEQMIGRAMTDIENMHGTPGLPVMENGMAVLTGSAPVVTLRGYQKEVTEYTRGLGRLQCTLKGYAPCHNTQEVLERFSYDPLSDPANPSSSVFCAHGAGFVVEWYEVKDYMHVESAFCVPKSEDVRLLEEAEKLKKHAPSVRSESIGTDEVDRIIAGTYQANQGKKSGKGKYRSHRKKRVYGTGLTEDGQAGLEEDVHRHDAAEADRTGDVCQSEEVGRTGKVRQSADGTGKVRQSEEADRTGKVHQPADGTGKVRQSEEADRTGKVHQPADGTGKVRQSEEADRTGKIRQSEEADRTGKIRQSEGADGKAGVRQSEKACRTGDASRSDETVQDTVRKNRPGAAAFPSRPQKQRKQKQLNRKEYFLVDGYNIIFAWQELNEIAKDNIDGARGRLLDIMCNYQALKKYSLIVVFDAYRVQGHQTEYYDYHNIHVVYTKEAETADQYIERFAHENGRKYNVTVATSDGLEQIIIRGEGCRLVSARELEAEVQTENRRMHTEYLTKQPQGGNMPFEEALRRSRK